MLIKSGTVQSVITTTSISETNARNVMKANLWRDNRGMEDIKITFQVLQIGVAINATT